MENPIHDLIMGKLPGATTEENPTWQRKESTTLAVTTRAQEQTEKKHIKPLKVVDVAEAEVNVDQLKAAQEER